MKTKLINNMIRVSLLCTSSIFIGGIYALNPTIQTMIYLIGGCSFGYWYCVLIDAHSRLGVEGT